MLDISIASYSFHGLYEIGAMSVFQYLETIKFRYHCDKADIWNGMLTGYGEDYLRLIRQQMDERGLELHEPLLRWLPYLGRGSAGAGAAGKIGPGRIRAGRILGARTIRIDAGVAETEMSGEQLEYVAAQYERYCRMAAEFGAKLGPENHWGATTNAHELRKLFAAVKAENFALLLHVGNWANTPGRRGLRYRREPNAV